MLTLPPFEYHLPDSVQSAVALLAQHKGNIKVIAGGTDLLPNMKHRLFSPGHLVALKNIRGLNDLALEGGQLRLGAAVRLSTLADSPLVREHLPSLARAASLVAGPQLREMGTLGGNLCLDTRCVYYNQTYFWRQSLGFCLKKDGTVCHVVKAGRRCVAAASNDSAPVLMTAEAKVLLASVRGIREVGVLDFFRADGIANTVIEPDELLVEVRVPMPEKGWLFGYDKLRVRASIDYPALSVAVAAKCDAERRLERLRLVVSALGARPHVVGGLDAFVGRALDRALIGQVGAVAKKQCHPLTNINVDTHWRRTLIPVFVRRAFERASAGR